MNNNELSKEISYALRHAPWEYELEMDEYGWVDVNQLIEALNRDKKWKAVMNNNYSNGKYTGGRTNKNWNR